MINVILKNRSLIKLYKYSVTTFKFLNKHLYILSILSLIAKARKSVYYKVISWILKFIIVINLVLTSGLFYSLIDLQTPFNTIYSFYSDFLNPYLEIIKNKYQMVDISNINNSVENKYNNLINNNSQFNDANDLFENKESNKEEKIKSKTVTNIIFISGVAIFIYFAFFIPGGDTPPANLLEYNSLNQSLIKTKIFLNKNINILKYIYNMFTEEEEFIFNGDSSKMKSIDFNDLELNDSDIELNTFTSP
jgi:hypothetical protein